MIETIASWTQVNVYFIVLWLFSILPHLCRSSWTYPIIRLCIYIYINSYKKGRELWFMFSTFTTEGDYGHKFTAIPKRG